MADAQQYVTLKVEDGTEMRAYVARPQTSNGRRGVLVLQEAFGVNEHIRDIAQRLAAEGYLAIAPELFHRTAPGFEVGYEDFSVVLPHTKALTPEGMIADMRAAHTWLTSQPSVDPNRIAAIGFCMGGRAAFLANTALPIRATASYYGSGIAPALLDRVPSLHGPQLFYWGGKDKNLTPEYHQAVTAALRAAGKPFVNVEISDADHGFNCDRRAAYNPRAAKESWALTMAFFDQHLSDG